MKQKATNALKNSSFVNKPYVPRIAVVGATGLVGRTMLDILKEQNLDSNCIQFNSKNLTKNAVEKFAPEFALFAVSAEVSKQWAPFFTSLGCTIIDNSSAYRTDPEIPLIIPECNGNILSINHNLISNPNCSTIAALVALKPLDDEYKIKRIIYSTYQAISGAGANPVFAHPIENNVIPYIEGEEEKMCQETKKILGRNDIAVSATCVRVPVQNCHSISINIEFHKQPNLNKIKEILKSAQGIVYLEDKLPMPIIANGKDPVYVGRVRYDAEHSNTINLFVANDNIRKGAALNAVQIMKCLMY